MRIVASLVRLLGKQILHMLKRLELNRIAGRVKEEHRGLFSGFAFEVDVGLDDEIGAGGLQSAAWCSRSL